jgi:homoserine O-acetyltransferase
MARCRNGLVRPAGGQTSVTLERSGSYNGARLRPTRGAMIARWRRQARSSRPAQSGLSRRSSSTCRSRCGSIPERRFIPSGSRKTYGTLTAARDNVILSATRSAATRTRPVSPRHRRREHARRVRGRRSGRNAGQRAGMVGRDDRRAKAFDTDRYFVVSTNLLGGCRGRQGPRL